MSCHVTFRFAFAAAFAAAVGASAGPLFVQEPAIPAGQALVYVFFPKLYFHTPDAEVFAGSEPVAVLSQGEYLPWFTAPGRIEFSTSRYSAPLTVEVEAGNAYFLKLSTHISRWIFELLPREQALREIGECQRADNPPR